MTPPLVFYSYPDNSAVILANHKPPIPPHHTMRPVSDASLWGDILANLSLFDCANFFLRVNYPDVLSAGYLYRDKLIKWDNTCIR